jgi:cytochrome c biogenesis protein CcmG/thiol:disulfide interchange protein DsbE
MMEEIKGRRYSDIRARGVAALVAASLLLGSGAAAAVAGIPQNGAPAPQFSLELIANGQGTVSLDKYKGKGLYLNFFASWCQPCKAEVPSIVQFSKQYAKRNVVVLGIDELESLNAAKGFVAQFKMPYPIGIDDSGAIGASYGLIGMPLSVFIGPDGKIVKRVAGEMSTAQIKAGLDSIAR